MNRLTAASLARGAAYNVGMHAKVESRNVDASSRAPGELRRVLVAHTDKSLRQLLKLKLACAGYEVLVADDAFEAGRAVLRQRPDLIVLDVEMPFLAELEFVAARSGASQPRLISVLFLARTKEACQRARRLGAPACFTAPLDTEDFLDAVARCFGGALQLRAGLRTPAIERAA